MIMDYYEGEPAFTCETEDDCHYTPYDKGLGDGINIGIMIALAVACLILKIKEKENDKKDF